jgi:hypothetical protein
MPWAIDEVKPIGSARFQSAHIIPPAVIALIVAPIAIEDLGFPVDGKVNRLTVIQFTFEPMMLRICPVALLYTSNVALEV